MRKYYDTEPTFSDKERSESETLFKFPISAHALIDTAYTSPMVRVFVGEIQIGTAFKTSIPTNPGMDGRWEYSVYGADGWRSSYYDSPEEAAKAILQKSGFVLDVETAVSQEVVL